MLLMVSVVWLGGQTGLAQTQTCAGLSNVLTINEPFGTVSQNTSAAGLTSYQYVTATCPDNGQYTLAESVRGTCFDNAWHAVAEDHTPGDVRGRMLVINASNAGGAFYQQSLAGLCGGTQYEFSVWGLNLLRPGICSEPGLPNLTIHIETSAGRVLQAINFGSISVTQTPTWRRYSTLFTVPLVNEPLVVKLINNQGAGGCGNDLAFDDIQLKQCEVCPPTPVFVPDAFSPNNDGVNDELTVFLANPVEFSMKVYNRWGSVIFTSDNLNQRWNGSFAGSPCPAGDYSWSVSYQLTDPSNVTRTYVRTGHVVLLR